MKRFHHLLWLNLLLLALPAQALDSGLSIIILSDIHVMAPELVEQDGTAWQTALQADRKLLDYSQTIFDMLTDSLLEEHPNLVLITGDLTKDGERLSHQHVVAQLDKLRQAGIKPFVIPGNHDLGTKHALLFRGETTAPAETISEEQFAELYRNYGYGPESLRDSTSLSYCCEPVDSLLLIGIDSGAKGQIAASTLDWICQQASEAQAQGKQVLAMMHHALVPHFTGEERFVETSVVQDYETVRNRLSDAGIRVVLTGHIHISDIAKDYNADLTRPIYDVSTGSTASYPCDYRQLTLSADRTSLSIDTRHVTTLPDHPDFGSEAKERIQQFLSAFAKNRLKNNTIASLAAKAFLVHAEGNENESDEARHILSMLKLGKMFLGASIKSKLAARGLTWEEVESVVTSMMTDTSSLGIEGRENCTNDLTLTIPLLYSD